MNMKEAINYLENTLQDNDKVVVACSGGPDSMCLLSLVCNVKKRIQVIVAHVNHNLRKESASEKLLVESFCKEHNVIFEYLELHFDNNSFSEQKAHKIRYNFFIDTVKKYNAAYLLTAHHGDDLIETILMRLTRGSNLNGYLGFKKESIKDGYSILRPLVYTTKQELEDYCNKYNIKYGVDKTNKSTKYTRNRYRKYILPFLKKEDKNIHLKYLKFSEELTEYDNFIKNYVDNLKVINKESEIDLVKFKKESLFIQKKILEAIIKDIQAYDWFDISDNQVKEIIKLSNSKKNSIDLNNNYQAIKTNNKLIIKKKQEVKNFEYILDDSIQTDDWQIYKDKTCDDTNNSIRLNSKEIALPLIIRNRRNGDKMEVKNLYGTKKIKDILIDEKIDIQKRDCIPLLTDSNNNILWIPGLKKSKFAKNKDEKYDIMIRHEARREKNDNKK